MKGWIRFIVGVVGRLRGVGTGRTAAALSFVTVLGLVPLLTVAVVIAARYPLFQQWFDALERFLLRHLLPASSSVVRGYLVDFTNKAAGLQGVSIALVVVTAIMMVATVEHEIDAIWDAREPRSIIRRVFIYALGVIAGPLLIGAAIYSTSWLIEESVAQVPLASHAIPFLVGPLAVAITAFAFTLLYLLMPARHVPLRAALAGGLFAALGFEVAKRGFAFYIATVPTYEVVYGALAALPLFLVWVYVSWVVVLVGAAVAATLAEGGRRGSDKRRGR
ncbi:MAG: YihY family inner membrane protein [Aromatoleum sp.]|nr:YihY family inner membrane protein [Aromatoleum sp.]